ncbi:phosphoglycerate kinase [Candidatus Mycoplasma mahonii]|uniref:phosphoglycerate kinase n=1 Tax=Candidatus Mycoplasma mahonii TaxID=3004105 RepID=UPI0026EEB188|nr:phosphoglycerate kinase [Candidatus Mycoplasma mahonii]WKX02352.1 phosphoglycerate kinase [Candidatus Mycoplasma mahonii]
MDKKTIDDINLSHKKILIRVDFNVPVENGVITSDKRISAALPTIKKVIAQKGKAILFSHLGRITSEEDKIKKDLSIVAKDLSKKLGQEVKFINATRGPLLEGAINAMHDGEVLMFQNTRYEDLNNKAESKNDPVLGKYWASLGDIFINDAFGTAHRAHASNVGIASNIPISAVGYLVEKELRMLGKGLDIPQKPFIAIVGGAKVSDKIKMIKNLLKIADKILIGGGMCYTFQKALGHSIGDSLLEADYIDMAKSFLDKANGKIILPVDYAVASSYANESREIIDTIDIPNGKMSLDIGPKTIKLYEEALQGAKTVVWNGPMGVAEFNNFKDGTEAIATAISKQSGVFSIIGGGDSAAAAIKLGFEDKFTHISTGGGASLTYMEGKPLPGVEAIQNK